MLEHIEYKNPLIIGTGGGNDIVSASFILAEFIAQGKSGAIAGMCSPGAWHLYCGKKEAPINIVSSNTFRFTDSKTPVELSFIDGFIPALLQKQGVNVPIYNLSARHGTDILIDELNSFVKKNGYDGVIALDVGGDILARGKKDPTILSPLMDFAALYVVSKLDVPSTLVEFGLQTDGELRPKGCEEIFDELCSSGVLRQTENVSQTKSLDFFKTLYSSVKKVRHGHTAHMTFQTLDAKEDIHTEYRFHLQIGNKKWKHSFPIVLESKYFGKVFTINVKELAKTRELAFPFKNSLDQYIKTKQIVDSKTELDLLYVRDEDICLWLGMLCPQIEGELRREILQFGLKQNESYDCALLWAKDHKIVSVGLNAKTVSDFTVIGSNCNKVDKIAKTIEDILKDTINPS